MKRITCLILVLLLSLGTCIGAYAEQSTTNNMQNKYNEQVKDEIVDYIMGMTIESRKSLVEDPQKFVKNNKELSKLVSSLSSADKKEFYSAFEQPENELKINEEENHTIRFFGISPKTWEMKFLELLAYINAKDYIASKHFIDRAVERGISPEKAIAVLEKGRHCIDLFTKARVVWDKSKNMAIIIDANKDRFLTIYDDVSWSKIVRWAVNNWKW